VRFEDVLVTGGSAWGVVEELRGAVLCGGVLCGGVPCGVVFYGKVTPEKSSVEEY